MSMEASVKAASGATESNGLSMLDIAKHAVRTVIQTLNDQDRLCVITFCRQGELVLPLTKMDAAPALSASMLGLELHSWIADRKGICQGDQVTLCDVVARAAKESRLRNAWSWVEQFPHGLILAEVQPRTSGFIITQSKNDQRTDCQVSLQVRATLPATGGAKFCIMLGAKLSKGVKHLQCLGERGAAGEAGKTLAEEVLTRMTFGSGREAQMVKREDALHAESSAKHGCGLIQADPERVPSKKNARTAPGHAN
ncbi:unnamed protein product [Effrenium voratum]|nr:unnamed protein product [Effrenium voratum]